MKAEIEKRILDIKNAIRQSEANHNALLGRLGEAEFMLAQIFEKECKDSSAVPAPALPVEDSNAAS